MIFLMNCMPIVSQFSMVQFRDGPWENVLAEAGRVGLPVMVYGNTDWCGVCEWVEQTTFCDTAVARVLNQEFIPVKYDMEAGEGRRIAMKFRCFVYPFFLVFGSDGRLWYTDVGGIQPENFLEMLRNARDPSKHLTLAGVSAAIDLPWPQIYRDALVKRAARRIPSPAEVREYLANEADWSQEIPWSVLSRFGNGVDGENFIIHNRRKLDWLYGRKEINDKLFDFMFQRLNDLAEHPDTTTFASLMHTIDTLFFAKQDMIRFNYTIHYANMTGDWPLFMRALSTYIDTATTPHPAFIARHGWMLLDGCEDTALLQQVVEWIVPIAGDDAPIDRQQLCAALLHKIGKDELAESRLVRAIQIGKDAGKDTVEAEALLNDIRNNRPK